MGDYQKSTFVRIVRAILETINESGTMGAPSGILYTALMAQGMSLDTYQRLMGVIKEVGYVTEEHHCYHMTDKGRAWLAR